MSDTDEENISLMRMKMRSTSVAINSGATIVSILSVCCVILLVVAIVVSENLGEPRKHTLVGAFIGVATTASLLSLFVVRRAADVPTLVFLTNMTYLLTGVCFITVIGLF
jgi:protein-S-isoprenylcysteine O-methyltransferase Ste14